MRPAGWLNGIFPTALLAWLLGAVPSAQGAIEYHFVPAMNGQPVGYAQGAVVAPETGPAAFTVTVLGARAGTTPGNTPQEAHAYLDKWGLGVLNPQVAFDKSITGQVEMNAKNGGEYIRLEFQTAVRLTSLTFASVGAADNIRMESNGASISLGDLFQSGQTIRDVSRAQGYWPGQIDLTKANQPLAFAKVWDFYLTSGDGVQLENVGVEVPEPTTWLLWAAGLSVVGLLYLRRRTWQPDAQ